MSPDGGDGAWAQVVTCPVCKALPDWCCIGRGVEAVGAHPERQDAARRHLARLEAWQHPDPERGQR